MEMMPTSLTLLLPRNILPTHLVPFAFPLLHLYTLINYNPDIWCHTEGGGFPFEWPFLSMLLPYIVSGSLLPLVYSKSTSTNLPPNSCKVSIVKMYTNKMELN